MDGLYPPSHESSLESLKLFEDSRSGGGGDHNLVLKPYLVVNSSMDLDSRILTPLGNEH